MDRRAGRVVADGTLTPVSASGGDQEEAPRFLSEEELRVLRAVCDRLVPEDDTPGALERWVCPSTSTGCWARFSSTRRASGPGARPRAATAGTAAFARFHRLTALDELAWRTRIEGSRGIPEREFNGPVEGSAGARTGRASPRSAPTSATSPPTSKTSGCGPSAGFTALVYEHCCEGMYGAPEYGGNRDGVGWEAIEYPGDVQPRGCSDAEVAGP